MRARNVSLLVLSLLASACAGSSPIAPGAPPPTTAVLTVRLEAQCAVTRVMSADVFIDGQYVNSVASGGSLTQTVPIGSHHVEAAAYNITGQVARKWGPEIVNVPAAGFSELFYCS